MSPWQHWFLSIYIHENIIKYSLLSSTMCFICWVKLLSPCPCDLLQLNATLRAHVLVWAPSMLTCSVVFKIKENIKSLLLSAFPQPSQCFSTCFHGDVVVLLVARFRRAVVALWITSNGHLVSRTQMDSQLNLARALFRFRASYLPETFDRLLLSSLAFWWAMIQVLKIKTVRLLVSFAFSGPEIEVRMIK